MKHLIEKYIIRGQDVKNQAVRARCGTAGTGVGIGTNLLLTLIKLLAGLATGSVAVVADAVNNLSDAGGSLVAMISIRLARKPVDKDHPFGHGRYEYVGSLAVGVLILIMGVELFKTGVESILHPEPVIFSILSLLVLVLSIVLKGGLYFFYNILGKKIDASALLAAAEDSRGDVLATTAVLVSALLNRFFGWQLDGWMGLLVSLLVLKAGWSVCHDTLDKLLGTKPDPELGEEISRMLNAYDGILGIHDLVIHDYGPGRCMASVHAEVPADGDILEIHEIIDRAESEIGSKLNIPICIHMDPIVTDDPETEKVRELLESFFREHHPECHFHDLRRVPGEKQINLIFDVVIPADLRDTVSLEKELKEYAFSVDKRHHCVIRFDLDYFGLDR